MSTFVENGESFGSFCIDRVISSSLVQQAAADVCLARNHRLCELDEIQLACNRPLNFALVGSNLIGAQGDEWSALTNYDTGNGTLVTSSCTTAQNRDNSYFRCCVDRVEPLPPSGDTCAAALDLNEYGSDDGRTVRYVRWTTDLSNDYTPATSGCPGGSGADWVGVWVSDRDTAIVAGTNYDGTDFDTVLYVRTEPCPTGDEIVCNDDFEVPQSQVTFSASAGTRYYFFVDGYSGQGKFELRINRE